MQMHNFSMLRLDAKRMQRQIARCKKVHPRAVRVDRQTVRVIGSKGETYTVRLARPRHDLPLAACNCAASKLGAPCFHLVAAASVPGTVLAEQ